MRALLRLILTVYNLKVIQIRYQLWYRIRRCLMKLIGFNYQLSIKKEGHPIELKSFINKYTSYSDYHFTFLNQTKAFIRKDIDWNFKEFGKLWTYNLNYFDFLLQQDMTPQLGQELINDYISKLQNHSSSLDPYPTALRGINWIKFISQYSFSNSQIFKFSNSLHAQYKILLNNLEYHLLGNHLLENGFSLLFGAFYFKDEKQYHKACEIILAELNEQILDDGGHFELSPMYHQIILDRLLDCINLVQNNKRFDEQESLLKSMIYNALIMLQWLNCMTFSNGDIPLLNDSSQGIAPSTNQLNQYAIRLGIISEETIRKIHSNLRNLSESGYRRFNGINYECIIDIGFIGAAYQPGHAHADTFNFVLNINNKSIFIDPGISTYESNKIRLEERGTASHNTVTVNKENSSKVWSSFRVAERATVDIFQDSKDKINAAHNGYRNLNTKHQRQWKFKKDEFEIIDTLIGHYKNGKAHFWTSHQLFPEICNNSIKLTNCIVEFENANDIRLIKTKIPCGYNNYINSYKIEVLFNSHLATTIKILN